MSFTCLSKMAMIKLNLYVYRKALVQGLQLINNLEIRQVCALSRDINSSRKVTCIKNCGGKLQYPQHFQTVTTAEDTDVSGRSRPSTVTDIKGRRKLRKLHSRVLTAQEEENEREFLDAKLFSTDDLFGSKISHSKQNENRNDTVQISEDEFGNMSVKFHKYEKIEHSSVENPQNKNSDQTTPNRHGTDREFLQSISAGTRHKYANRFGTLSDENQEEHPNNLEVPYETTQDKAHRRLSKTNRRNIPFWYGKQIEKLGKDGKVDEAIKVLEDWMLTRDRVKPWKYHFSVLIGVLARHGETEKAFKIFNKMKKMNFVPDAVTYTALFNACANCSQKESGLQRARKLHTQMESIGWQPNLITARSMIKAYGFCGDLHAAFSVMDDIANRYSLDPKCFSMLLMACIGDKENGVRLAAGVWQLMRQHGIKPDVHLYNLLLRVIRDCGIGTGISVQGIPHIEDGTPTENSGYSQVEQPNIDIALESSRPSTNENFQFEHNNVGETIKEKLFEGTDLMYLSHGNQNYISTVDNSFTTSPTNFMIQNVDFDKHVKLLSQIDFSERSNRMALVGGTENFLENMKQNDAKANIKTFALLLDNSLQSTEEEDHLLQSMKKYKIRPDQEFYNTLLRKRCLRQDLEAAKVIMEDMSNQKLPPNMETFEIYAIACRNHKDGLQLLNDVEGRGSQPSKKLLTNLLRHSGVNFFYKLDLIRKMADLNIQPDVEILQYIEKDIKKGKQLIVEAESNKCGNRKIASLPVMVEGFNRFMVRYTSWLKDCQIS